MLFTRFKKRVRKQVGNERGQTMVEYLMLMGAAFIATYLMVTGPIASFTTEMLLTIRGGIQNVVRNAEWTSDVLEAGQDPRTPSSPERFKPLHF